MPDVTEQLDTTALPKISGVEVGEHGDPVTWKDPCSPFVLISDDGEVSSSHSVTGKRALLNGRGEGGLLLLPWVGRHRTSVFVVDDLMRAARGLS